MEGKKEDSILVALLLTLTGGFLDAYTFMLRGGTFANAQTGNIVMTGVNLAKGNAGDAITNVCAIIAFVRDNSVSRIVMPILLTSNVSVL